MDSTITTCHNTQTLPPGVHQLQVTVNTANQTSVLFDGLYLHSMYKATSEVDIQIHIDDPAINAYFLQNAGDTLNFDFVGSFIYSFFVENPLTVTSQGIHSASTYISMTLSTTHHPMRSIQLMKVPQSTSLSTMWPALQSLL